MSPAIHCYSAAQRKQYVWLDPKSTTSNIVHFDEPPVARIADPRRSILNSQLIRQAAR